MATDSGNMPVLMVLGDFQFSLNTLVYQEWQRTTEWKWPGQDRFGQLDALQFTGLGPETLQLPGVLYPNWKGDINSVDELRGMADDGQPLQLIDSMGYVLGRWVIEKIDEKQTQHDNGGKPRKIEFTLSLRKYDNGEPADDGASILDQASDAAGAATSATSSATSGALSSFSSMASSIKSTAASALGNLKAAADQVKTAVAPVMAEAQSVIGAVNRSIDTVNDLRATVADVESQVKSIGSVAAAVGGAKTLFDKISTLGMGAASATRVVENVSLIGSGMGSSVTNALSNAHAATTGVSSLLSTASSKASSLISSLTS